MADVTIYTTRICGYCIAAKRLLAQRQIPYDEVDVSTDADKRAWLVTETGQRTVPQIFIKGESIGGYDELAALDKSGALSAKLAAPV
ncbi:MAG TPA: glutaredoxin 3 [Polyangiaceae bacterium]